jgi:F-type H+-transporting ATPase subunit b
MGEAIEALGINGWNLIVQLIAFLVFMWLFWRFALGPIVRRIDERRDRIQESMEAAQRMQAELAATAARNEQVLAEARREAQQIVANAREAGDAAIARAREAADAQAAEYLSRAEATLRQETESARQQLRQEVAGLAVTAASRIVRKELDPASQTRLIEETLAEAAPARTPTNGSGAPRPVVGA